MAQSSCSLSVWQNAGLQALRPNHMAYSSAWGLRDWSFLKMAHQETNREPTTGHVETHWPGGFVNLSRCPYVATGVSRQRQVC